MKSKRAKEILSRSYDGGHVCVENAESAVEIAEADRDAKAVEAHRTSCESYYNGGCCGPHEPCTAKCSYMKKFIQKLNEE